MYRPFDLDWTLVRSFLAVLENGSLMGAARTLGISQPTVGRHIADLEAQLGVALFERTGRGLVSTEMAARLTEAARAMEAGARQMERVVMGADTHVAGTVVLSASQMVAYTLLPAVLQQMRQALPEVQVELLVSNEVINLLQRDADIALRMVSPVQSSLIARRIAQVSIGCYAHEDYLAARGEVTSAEQLLRHDLLGRIRDDRVVQGFAEHGVVVAPGDFCFRTDDQLAYWEAVRAGMGIGFMAENVANMDPKIRRLLPELELGSMPMWLTVHREIHGNRRIRAVYDFLAETVPKELAWRQSQTK